MRYNWLAILAMAALFVGATGICRAELVDRVVAVVNDDIILQSDIERAMAPLQAQLKSSGRSEVEQRIILENQRPVIIDQLINEKLTDQQAKRNGISVGEDDIDRAIARIKAVNNLSDEQLAQHLKADGVTLEAYRDQIRDQLLQSRIVNREVKSKVVVTDEDVAAYYNAHKAEYTGVVKYHLRHLMMKIDQSDDNRSRISDQMEELHKRLEAGESFESLAKIYSQASTAENGGDLGLFESRLLAAPIRKAIEGLESGQFTPVLETDQGFQIFFIQEVVSTGGKTLEEATAEIHDKLYAEQVEQKFKSWLSELRQRAHIQILE